MDTATTLGWKGYTPEGDNTHLDARDTMIAAEICAAWTARAGGVPRVGDFVRMPNGHLRRCAHGWGGPEGGMQTCDGGSFSITKSGLASMSGSLYGLQLWEYFQPTEEARPGRFWFFSHGLAGAGRGVDVWLPCAVFQLVPFTMTEAEAKAHPKALHSADFWGAGHHAHAPRLATAPGARGVHRGPSAYHNGREEQDDAETR